MRILVCIALALLTTACASSQQGPAVVQPQQTLLVPPSLTLSCPSLPLAEGGTLDVLLKNHVETAKQYRLCADGKDDLVRFLRSQRGVKVE